MALKDFETSIQINAPQEEGKNVSITLEYDGDLDAGWEAEHEVLDERNELPSNVEWEDAPEDPLDDELLELEDSEAGEESGSGSGNGDGDTGSHHSTE